MAPTRSKKRKSTESTTSVDIQTFPAPPQMIPTKTRSPARTPSRSPIKKTVKMGITLGQKQALIDNLQLEITERARKLRAQYNLQAQGLRTRIEIRVNRIPMALRRAKMGDLLLKHSNQAAKAAITAAPLSKVNSPRKNLIQAEQSNSRVSPSPQRGTKRLSNDISLDKENAPIENPKKRTRGPPAPPERTTSRAKMPPAQILSPRAANSQTLPRSPIRPVTTAPGKSMLARPISPLKPVAPMPKAGTTGILNTMVDKAKSTRSTTTTTATTRKAVADTAGAGRGKRTTAHPPPVAARVGRGRASTISESSDSSTGTTIVRKPVPVKKDAPVKGRGVLGTIKGMGGQNQKKLPVGAKATTGATASAGGRVLRKRN